jgi:hypothetical protein
MTALQTYSLTVFSPDETDEWLRQEKRVLANLPALIEEIEENLLDILPEGYAVVIKEERASE